MKKPMKISYSKSVFATGLASIAIILTLVWILVPNSHDKTRAEQVGVKPDQAQAHTPTVAINDIPAVCNRNNTGPFNGKVLYDCVFGLIVKSDRAFNLMTPEAQATFIDKWQHKFDLDNSLTTEDGTYQAISKMVNSLQEIHTAFLPPEAAAQLIEHTQGNLVGIGAPMTRVGMRSKFKALGENPSQEALAALSKITADTLLVVYPAPPHGTPAEQAGLKLGDQIAAVDGHSLIGQTMQEAVTLISGKNQAGTKVVLSVKRPVANSENTFENIEIAITRDALHINQVSTEKLGNDFLYVKVTSFSKTVAAELSDALYLACTGNALPYETNALLEVIKTYKPEDCAIKGLIIDFRNNGGGVMEATLDMGQTIMESGNTITIQMNANGRNLEVRQRIDGDNYVQELVENDAVVKSKATPRVFRVVPDIPIAVLINEKSASSSEILAGMLRANDLAVLVGKPSYGKEVGQAFTPIDFGAAVKITTLRFLPGGVPLGVALIPDFEVEQSDAYLDNPTVGPDNQLAKAIEVLAQGKEAMEETIEESKTAAAQEAKAQRSIEVKAEHDKRDSDRLAAMAGQ
ncbi:PDZ domain-containing protein [bacterium]|nr:PDZ domain-containing protein [bacterium]